MAGHETYIALTQGFGILIFAFILISKSVKTENVPRGRIFEKIFYFMLALISMFALTVTMVLVVENETNLSHLVDPINAYFDVSTTIILVMFFFYMYYMIRKSILMFKQIREKGDKPTEYDL